MVAELKPYPAYKDSGVEWGVPAHWDVRRLGRFGRLFKGGGGTKEDARESGVPCVRYGDLYTQHQFFITATRACVAPELANTVYTPIRYGDVLFAGSGETIDEIGKSAVNLIRSPACCGGDVIILRPSIDADARFLGYAMDCAATARQKACIGRGFTVVHIYSSDLKYVTVAIPSLPEQAAIVRFLDHADRRIRRYIRAKQKLIALLEEQKQAVIHEAVTGKIDVRTGRTYPAYRDSGMEWLRTVPAHWRVLPLKRAFVSMDYGISDTGTDEGTIPVLTMGDIQRNGTVTVPGFGGVATVSPTLLVQDGDLLFNRTNSAELVGKVGLFRSDGRAVTFASYLVRMRSRRENNPEFLNLALNDAGFVSAARREAVPSLHQSNLNPSRYGRLQIPLPPTEEQETVVDFVDGKVLRVDSAITRTKQEIAFLREYRTCLIADVVTGKLDVREVVARLPDLDRLAVEDDPDDGRL